MAVGQLNPVRPLFLCAHCFP